MTDSYIQGGAGGTSFVGKDAVSVVAAASLIIAIKTHLETGGQMRVSRLHTPTKMLAGAGASAITGKPYKRGQLEQALKDLKEWKTEKLVVIQRLPPREPIVFGTSNDASINVMLDRPKE